MADQRSLSFGVRFGTDTAPLDELNEKQKQAQEEAMIRRCLQKKQTSWPDLLILF